MVGLARDQTLDLLGSVGFGRIVFIRDALPAIRRIDLVIRTHEAPP